MPLTPDQLHIAYAQYSPAVMELRKHRGEPLGYGHHKHVYALPGWDELVAKEHSLPTAEERQWAFAQEEPVLIRTAGLDGFEQTRATSPADTMIIAERIPGAPTEKLNKDMLEAVDVPMLKVAVGQLATATFDRGIWLDCRPGNIMLSAKNLWFLDPEPETQLDSFTFASNIKTLAHAIASAGSRAHGIRRQVRLEVLKRLRTAVTTTPGILYREEVYDQMEPVIVKAEHGIYDRVRS